MGAPSKGGDPLRDTNNPFRPLWGRVKGALAGPKIPKPPAAPPPPDEAAAMLRELSRAQTDRELRKGSGRHNAFLTQADPPPVMSGPMVSPIRGRSMAPPRYKSTLGG